MSKSEPENKSGKELEPEESETEAISNVYRELAVKAAKSFDKREYTESLLHLLKLQEQRPLDARFTHNTAVVEFFTSDFRNIAKFESKLNSVCSLVSMSST